MTAVLPDARIVIDKFHVVRMANDAVEKVRKSLREQLTPKQRRGLMHDRFVLLKRERDLNDRERLLLDGWTKSYPELGAAYRLKERFYGIYEGSGQPTGRHCGLRGLEHGRGAGGSGRLRRPDPRLDKLAAVDSGLL